jgi:hypothetical protein
MEIKNKILYISLSVPLLFKQNKQYIGRQASKADCLQYYPTLKSRRVNKGLILTPHHIRKSTIEICIQREREREREREKISFRPVYYAI